MLPLLVDDVQLLIAEFKGFFLVQGGSALKELFCGGDSAGEA